MFKLSKGSFYILYSRDDSYGVSLREGWLCDIDGVSYGVNCEGTIARITDIATGVLVFKKDLGFFKIYFDFEDEDACQGVLEEYLNSSAYKTTHERLSKRDEFPCSVIGKAFREMVSAAKLLEQFSKNGRVSLDG